VLAVTRFTTDDEAVALANATDYGMVAGIWSADTDRAQAIAERIDAARCWVNAYWVSDPSVSAAARRRSGIGALETGTEALREFLSPKEVSVSR
jgi:acyl-CoA reductase-like NAD-dependent aldehyde dehydrogenase